jgi:ribosomal protein L1
MSGKKYQEAKSKVESQQEGTLEEAVSLMQEVKFAQSA